jgi:hypothetical protein
MVRIEAYTVMDGLRVRVVGTCTQDHLGGGRCEGDMVGIMVTSPEIERYGVGRAVSEAVWAILHDRPDIFEYTYH